MNLIDRRGTAGGRSHGNEATLDHVLSRLDKKERVSDGQIYNIIVLACSDCNHKRGADQVNSIPIEERRETANSDDISQNWVNNNGE